ncbi:hypothetical protein [Roseateles sp. BYS87W]|uniref:SH3 domain-containing protein n=1 Tax=Pelomonas baiyunensis TaxID=3299026 RepID=A0ABW7H0D9_9BURK
MSGLAAALLVAVATQAVQAAPAGDRTRWVKATSLMLRAEPSATGRILDRLPQGHALQLDKLPAPGDEWCAVMAAGRMIYTAYVACRYLSDTAVAPQRAGEGGVPADRRWVTGSRLQLRAEPRPDAPALATLALNTPVKLTGPDAGQGYCPVQLVEGPPLAGYTACRYLEPSPLNVANLTTPWTPNGTDNPDFDPARAFWIEPSWELMAFYARRVESQRAALGDRAPKGPDAQLERMKARLSGEIVPASAQTPRVPAVWADLLASPTAGLAGTLGLYGPEADAQVRALAKSLPALPALPAVGLSWWRQAADLAGPGEPVDGLAQQFGAQVQWLHESLQPGSPQRGEVAPGTRIERMTRPLRRVSLMSNQSLREERLTPERSARDWDPTVDVNCDGWTGAFLHGEPDRGTAQRNGYSAPAANAPYTLFRLWTAQPLPSGPAHWTRQTFKLDRAATGFVSGEWRTVDLDRDGTPDLAWLQLTGRGPGHLDGPMPYDDPWLRVLLANVAGRWLLLEVDTFSYGCGC